MKKTKGNLNFFYKIGRCIEEDCDSDDNDWRSGARSLDDDPQSDALTEQPGDGALMASYSVFVVEPGEDIGNVLRPRGVYIRIILGSFSSKIHC